MDRIYKYPRTRHIEGSKLQVGDEDLSYIKLGELNNYYVVLEEKVDGANCGISFDCEGKLWLQSRGHYLNGGYGERQFDMFKMWANAHKAELYELLQDKYIMYGEWLYAKHTVFYDELTHYFMEFDIFDKQKEKFLSTKKRKELLKNYNFIKSVPVLYSGKISKLTDITSFLGKSNFKSKNYMQSLEKQCKDLGLSYELAMSQTDNSDLMEGIYIKCEGTKIPIKSFSQSTIGDNITDSSVVCNKSKSKNITDDDKEFQKSDYVIDRCKYVRATFLNTILDSETHWVNRPIIPNLLRKDSNIF